MTELARIPLAGGGVVLVESAEVDTAGGPVKAGRVGDRVHEMSATLQDLLEPVVDAAQVLLDQLSRAKPAELEVEFGIALSAQAGAVITKTAMSGNLKVKMKWRRDGPEVLVQEESGSMDIA
ncbi:CU044_2847 family protein [Micromonospora sp. WMMD735]|uniref:CU044_2847 family protein n=1 Tax=Micromonospora sp. WMMD735 TaxID=3404130 RepID=UPI003B943610